MKNLWLWTFSAILWNCIFLKLNRSSLLNYFLIDIPLSKIWKKAPAWFLFHILNPYSLQESAWYESGAKCTICATNHHSHKVRIQGIPKQSACLNQQLNSLTMQSDLIQWAHIFYAPTVTSAEPWNDCTRLELVHIVLIRKMEIIWKTRKSKTRY